MRAIPENDQAESLPLSPANPSSRPSSDAHLLPSSGQAAALASPQSNDDLQDRLSQILIQISGADPAQITPEARLIDESLGIKIREEDLLKFRTVGDIQNHLRSMEQPDAQAT